MTQREPRLPWVEVLKLDRNYIGDEGCATLVRGLAACKSVGAVVGELNSVDPWTERRLGFEYGRASS